MLPEDDTLPKHYEVNIKHLKITRGAFIDYTIFGETISCCFDEIIKTKYHIYTHFIELCMERNSRVS